MALATAISRNRRVLIFAGLASFPVFLAEIFDLSGVKTFSTGLLLGALGLLPPLVLWYAVLGLWYAAWFRGACRRHRGSCGWWCSVDRWVGWIGFAKAYGIERPVAW